MIENIGRLIRVAAPYVPAVVSTMGAVAQGLRSVDEIDQHVRNILGRHSQHGAQSEYGHHPQAPQQFVYLSWAWDPHYGCWRVCRWDGYMWIWA